MGSAYEEYFDSLGDGEAAMTESEFNAALAPRSSGSTNCENCGCVVKDKATADGSEFGYDVLCIVCQDKFYCQWSGEDGDNG